MSDNNDSIKLKPCPYCLKYKLRYSVKVKDAHKEDRKLCYFHLAYTCDTCHSYGRRVLITASRDESRAIKTDVKYKKLAAEAWNLRGKNVNEE